jgi:hypothetical protein
VYRALRRSTLQKDLKKYNLSAVGDTTETYLFYYCNPFSTSVTSPGEKKKQQTGGEENCYAAAA